MRRVIVSAMAVAVVATSVCVPFASATTLYQDDNYGGGTFGGTNTDNAASVGTLHDKASSMTRARSSCVTVFEDLNYLGASATTCMDWNTLNQWTENLGWPGTWGDRIDSFKRSS